MDILCSAVSKQSKSRKLKGGNARGAYTLQDHRVEDCGSDSAWPDLLAWRAGVFSDPLRDAALLWGVVILVAISRWLAFPASIWDMDEANFALGVLNFDPVHNQPHAPFFPLWIALGKVVYWVFPGSGPAAALQLVSAAFSVWILWPLWTLWSAVLPRAQALAATALYLALPGPWLLSGRAYSEPTATALLITTVALWLPRDAPRSRLAGGGAALAAVLLVRPQWLIVVVPFGVWRMLRCRGWIDRSLVVAVPAVIGSAAVIVVMSFAGGVAPLWEAAQQHWSYMARAAGGFDWMFAEFGLHAAAGGLVPGMLWLSLALLGALVLLGDKGGRRDLWVVVGLVLAPYVLLLLTSQNPTLPRYALPILALTCGLVVAGISRIVGQPKRTLAAVGVCVVLSVALAAPVLGTYRREPSPVVAAFDHVEASTGLRAVVVDRRLIAFVMLEKVTGRLRQQVLWDYQVELGWRHRRSVATWRRSSPAAM